MKTNIILSIIIVVLSLIAGLLLGYSIFMNKPKQAIIKTEVLYDTIYLELPAKPLIIDKIAAELEYIRDTILLTRPFIAKADTVLELDTIKLFYTYPESYFSLQYLPKSDSIMIPQKSIIKTEIKKREWWEIPVYVLSGFGVGYILANEK